MIVIRFSLVTTSLKMERKLMDAPKKALDLSFQVKARKDEVATLYLKRSGPVNAIDELSPQPCFHMNSAENQKYGGAKRTVFEFQVLDQSRKTSILDLAYKIVKRL